MSKLLYISIFFICSRAFGADLPEHLKICNRNNPYLDKCIQESITELQQYTRHGDVEHGIPYLERMYFPILMRGKPIGPKKQLLLSINHTNIYGLSEYTVSGVNAHFKEKILKFDLHVDTLRVEGNYKLTGRYHLIRVNATDKVHGYLSNVNCIVRIKYRIIEVDGKSYIKVIHTGISIIINGGNMVFDNIFPGNRLMTKSAQKTINKKFKSYTEELISHLNVKFSARFTDIANKFLEKYTYDQLLPEA